MSFTGRIKEFLTPGTRIKLEITYGGGGSIKFYKTSALPSHTCYFYSQSSPKQIMEALEALIEKATPPKVEKEKGVITYSL
jgi:hypothetical protein